MILPELIQFLRQQARDPFPWPTPHGVSNQWGPPGAGPGSGPPHYQVPPARPRFNNWLLGDGLSWRAKHLQARHVLLSKGASFEANRNVAERIHQRRAGFFGGAVSYNGADKTKAEPKPR